MSATIRMIGCAVALAATASLGPAQAQQSQASTWCYASEADGVSLDLRISGCSTMILSGTLLKTTNPTGICGGRRGRRRAAGTLPNALRELA